jgi:hypothetical protein
MASTQIRERLCRIFAVCDRLTSAVIPQAVDFAGVPYRIRTGVAAVRGDFPNSETKGLASPPAKFLNSGDLAERTLLAETLSPRNRELCESRSFDLGCDLTG